MSRLRKSLLNTLCPGMIQKLEMLYNYEYMRLSSSGRETLDELTELIIKFKTNESKQ